MSASPEDIVITGIGLLTAVGGDVQESWANILAGRSGIREASVVPTDREVKVAGQLSIELEDDGLVTAESRPGEPGLDRCVDIARRATQEALVTADLLDGGVYDPNRFGIVLGSSLGGQRLGERFHRQWIANGLASADGHLLIDYPIDAVLDDLARRHNLRGPRCVQSNACAAGAVAIALALELLRNDRADAVLTGGVDPLAYLSFGGFQDLGALDPAGCAPYSRSTGTTLGEGAGCLVLERKSAAEERGAHMLAVVAGFGLSADAHHPTAPDPKGVRARVAMARALEMAGISTGDVDYINGHGTGTPSNDTTEPRAIKDLFGSTPPPVSSTKSITGHTLGAAGAVEAVVSALAIRDGKLPPTVIPSDAEATAGLDIVPNKARDADVRVVVSNSFAFGGNNASLVLTTPQIVREPGPASSRDVVITGIGALAGDARDVTDLAWHFRERKRAYGGSFVDLEGRGRFPTAEIPPANHRQGINPSLYRKMDDLSRRAAVAASQLLKARALSRAERSGTGVICATSGPIGSIETFERALIESGSGSAGDFPNTVMNAAAGYVGLLNGLRGPAATHYGRGPAAVTALYFASRLIATGHADRIVVLSADETPAAMVAGYAWIPGYMSRDDCRPFKGSGRLLGGAATAILLEAADLVPTGVPVLGRIRGFGMTGGSARNGRMDTDGAPWARAFGLALEEAGVRAEEVELLVSDACGVPGIDDVETRARTLAGLQGITVFAPKAFVGDTRASAPMIGLVHGLTAGADAGSRFMVSSSDSGGTYGSLLVEVGPGARP